MLKKFVMSVVFMVLNGSWCCSTFELIRKEQSDRLLNLDPFEVLGLEIPTLMRQSFNTREVKKAYKEKSMKFRPQVISKLSKD